MHQPAAASVPFMGLYPCYNTVTKKKQLPKVTAARRKEMMKNEKNRCKRRRYSYGSPAYLPGRLGRNVADFRHHHPAEDLSKQASAKNRPRAVFSFLVLRKPYAKRLVQKSFCRLAIPPQRGLPCVKEDQIIPQHLRLWGKYANFGSFGGFSPSTISGYNRRANLRLCR